ncbi:TetR/AcrR family transcriptional regulator [Endozoicomonadaceae bacterium StTr2]
MLKKSEMFTLARNVLGIFSLYGFQKTSMEDIAAAAGVSRQSVYKKFGTKKKCYEWAIHTYLEDMYLRIFTHLENNEADPSLTLMNVFDTLIGDAIEISSNPHGPKTVDDVLKATHASPEDWPLRFRSRLTDFLICHDLTSKNNAHGIAFLLIAAGKGLLLEETSREQFLKDMNLIIESIKK